MRQQTTNPHWLNKDKTLYKIKMATKQSDYEYEKELREFKKAEKAKRDKRKGKRKTWEEAE